MRADRAEHSVRTCYKIILVTVEIDMGAGLSGWQTEVLLFMVFFVFVNIIFSFQFL